jgi:nucleotide-binding universal stress UspA family protein
MGAAIAKRIVVGYDGSEAAQRALERAADLAGYGTTVTVVSVAPSVYGAGLPPLADPDDVERAHRLLEDARARLTARHVSARTLDPIGDPVAQIVETAAEVGADLVVVGTHNGHAVGRLVLGSTSAGVLRRAPCDVLVVR